MAITNKHLLLKAERLLPELLKEKDNNKGRDQDFKKTVDGIDFILPMNRCSPPCFLHPEVQRDPTGRRVTVYVCRKADGSLC